MYCDGHIANSVECVGANGYQLVSVCMGWIRPNSDTCFTYRGEIIMLINLNTLYYSFPIILSIMLTDFI